MMNNIRKKRFQRNFIFSLHFLQSVEFETAYLLPISNRDANRYAIEHL